MDTLKLTDIIHWFNAVRNLPDNQRYRALEGMWDTQLYSKFWLTKELNKCVQDSSVSKNIYIFGGWIGVLSSIMFQNSAFTINKIHSIDIDPWCESVANQICEPYKINHEIFKAITADMQSYQYDDTFLPHIVINTSTEHVTQEVYDKWLMKVPSDTLIVIQGNNFFKCSEHIRCTSSLQEFLRINKVKNEIFSGELPNSMYVRYMAIWRKD